jgi:hypothetical protein
VLWPNYALVNAPVLNLSTSPATKSDSAELFVPAAARSAAILEIPELLAALTKVLTCAVGVWKVTR